MTYVKGAGKVLGGGAVEATLEDGSTQQIKAKNVILATGSEVRAAVPFRAAPPALLRPATGGGIPRRGLLRCGGSCATPHPFVRCLFFCGDGLAHPT